MKMARFMLNDDSLAATAKLPCRKRRVTPVVGKLLIRNRELVNILSGQLRERLPDLWGGPAQHAVAGVGQLAHQPLPVRTLMQRGPDVSGAALALQHCDCFLLHVGD